MLEGMTQTQLYEIVSKMKGMIQQNTEQARQVLISNPPLTYALLQAQALLGMISPQSVHKILAKNPTIATNINNSNTATGTTMPPPTVLPPTIQPTIPVTPTTTLPPYVPGQIHPPIPGSIAPPNLPPTMVPPTMPPNMPPNMPPVLPDNIPEQQRALLQQVLSLTQDQIDKLPPEQRSQVQQLRQTLVTMRYG